LTILAILVKIAVMTNKTITATEAKNKFADLVDLARIEPITITRNDRAVAVVLSPSEYSRLILSDDAYWGEQAKNIKSTELASHDESRDFLNSILNASN
jgi:prevent-host-death family protein